MATTLIEDLRYSLRMLLKGKGTTVAAVLTLALGIGAATALFSVTTAVLDRPMPYEAPEQMGIIWQHTEQVEEVSVNRMDFADWREQSTLFEDMAIYRGASLNLTGDGQAERLRGLEASHGIFRVMGIEPALGRAFGPEADGPGAEREVILSHSFWQSRYGGDAGALGEVIRLNGESYTVIGVLPEKLEGEQLRWYGLGDLWVPFGLTLPGLPENRGYGAGHLAVARVKEGVTMAAARAELEALGVAQQEQYPDSNAGKSVVLTRLRETEVGDIRPALFTAFLAVAFLLLIACANVANLQLARSAERSQEMTIRTALGAGRQRLVRQLLTESLVLSLVGGLLGTAAAYWGVRLMAAALPDGSAVAPEQVTLNGLALAFAIGVTVVTGLLFGLLPAITGSRTDLQEALVDAGSRSATGGRARKALSQGLVVAEVALSLVLLIGATLMFQSLLNLRSADPGFDTQGVLSFRVPLTQAKYSETGQWTAFYDQLLEKIENLQGTQSAGFSSLLPLISGSSETIVLAEGAPLPKGPEDILSTLNQGVSVDYFKTMGIELRKGRLFTEADTADSPLVTVIDETMAETLWPGEDPLGKRLAFEFQRQDIRDPGPIFREVVGVVSHVRHYRLNEDSRVEVYAPLHQPPNGWAGSAPALWGVVRTSGDPMALAGPVRDAVRQLDEEIPVYAVQSLREGVSRHWAQSQMLTRILAAFAIAALLLAAIGLYGVLADSVARRTREIGIRLALGAGRQRVLRMVLRQGVLLAVIGVVTGAAGAFFLTQLLTSQLYAVPARDPILFTTLAAFLILIAAAATLVPALRATKVEPMTALRYE